MNTKTSELLDAFDIADLSFFLLLAKKNIKFILLASSLVALIVFFISLNIEKKFLSTATIVIGPDENKIVNINEAYSTSATGGFMSNNRINNIIATLKSDDVINYIVNDEKNQLEFKSLYNKNEKNIFSRIFTKKIIIDKNYINSILSANFKVQNVKNSDVLILSFVSNNPKISQLALNNIIESYQRYEVDSKIQITSYANTKVKERLKELKIQMAIADENLAKYKKEYNLVDTGNVKELNIASSIVRRDMRQILNVPIRDYFGNNLKGNFIADASSNSIVFTTLVNSSFSTSRVRRIEYLYQDNAFIRRQYFADNPYSYEEYFETILLDEVTNIEFSYMINSKWYALWPIDIITKRKIPELVKITFIKNNLQYDWFINPNIDYVYKK